MKKLIILSTLLFNSTSYGKIPLKSDKRMMIEVQSSSIEPSVGRFEDDNDWTNKSNAMAYGSFGFDLGLFEHTIKSNAYINHSQSKMYEEHATVMDTIIHPNIIVTRDVFKSEEIQIGEESRTQALLNQFEWSWGNEKEKFHMGRMWVDFGQGKFLNPINPLVASTAFSNIYGVNQAVDGFHWMINRDDSFKLHIYFLGDKRFEGFEQKITRTAFIRGEWKKSEQTQIQYLLGEDQERLKYGGEITHQFSLAKVYAQALRMTKRLDLEEQESQNLTHYVLGTSFEINDHLNLTVEGGKNHQDRLLTDTNEQSLSYLPMEDFIFAKLDIHFPEESYSGEMSYAVDQTSDFSFTQLALKWEIYEHIFLRIFSSSGGRRPKEPENFQAQNYFPETRSGVALRAHF